ncbi:hypothetical protein INS49_002894 [Diaporthe citri]|uniref:uncharacterized protein n=1 Tax=Diaporthe citri TaxID=83186 RepID=UPI001C827632|nr:uncharacterized protein INS49_002894 [Diaporthe citri]KAG6368681.1 hypothetical protein INS49_002894 [Diaporthe citri]
MLSHAILALVVAAAPALAIPPPIFGLPVSDYDTELSVAYTLAGNDGLTQDQPALALDPTKYPSVANYAGQYVVVMVDPDATTPDNPDHRFILHWLAPNMTQGDAGSAVLPQSGVELTNATENFTPYRPDGFAVPSEFDTFAGGANRMGFNLTGFVEAAGLGNPAAAEYMYVSRQAAVPGDFVALPGGEFPGGNGNAIFAV